MPPPPATGYQDPVDEASVVNSVVGSETGFRLRSPQNEAEDRYGTGDDDHKTPTETTSLLGAGAHGGSSSGGIAVEEDEEEIFPQGNPIWAGYDGFDHIPKWRRPSIYWLLVPYVLFTLAFGGSIVPKLNMVVELICKRHFADRGTFPGDDTPGDETEIQCTIPEVQRSVATFTMVLSLITGVLSAVTVPKIGSLSDRYGRRRLMAVASAGGIVGEAILILAAKFPDQVHYNWLLLGAFFDGLAGSFTSGSIMAHSYTSDCTPPSKRGVAIAYLHSCLYLGLAFGPLLAGYFARWTGELVSVFYVTLGCHIFFVLFIVAVLPESLSRKSQLLAREKYERDMADRLAAESEDSSVVGDCSGSGDDPDGRPVVAASKKLYATARRSNPLTSLRILWPAGAGNGPLRRNLVVLAAIDTVLLGAVMGIGQVTMLYAELMFDWGNFEVSQFVSAASLVRVAVLLGVLPVLNYIFRVLPARARARRAQMQRTAEKNSGADELDVWLLRTALISDVVGMVGYVLVRTPALFVVSGLITALGGMGSATIQTALTKHVPPERVGQLLGAIGVLHALSRVVAPLAFNGLYAITVDSYPKAVFILMLVLYCTILSLSFFFRPHVFLKEDSDETPPTSVPGVWDSEEALSDDELLPVP